MSTFYAATSITGQNIVVCETFGTGGRSIAIMDTAPTQAGAEAKAEAWQALYDNSGVGMREAA